MSESKNKTRKPKPQQTPKSPNGLKTRKEILSLVQKKLEEIQLTDSQKLYLEKIRGSVITFCHGPAGTSKTFVTCYASLDALCKHKYHKIILSKPIQEAGEKLGFLPGEVEDKIGPYMASYVGNYTKILGDELYKLFQPLFIDFEPLAYMRGLTYDGAFMVLDEAQNAIFDQLILFSTRMGKTSRQIICGDVSQYDIDKRKVELPEFIKLMEGIGGVDKFIFTEKDIMRHPILIEMVKRYEKWRDEKKR